MLTSLSADQTTTDNLLTNNTFDENTNGWTLSDSNVKRDSNSYPDAGNSPTIRFNGQTSTISQLVNLTGIEQGKEIKSYTVKYNGYGCGNTPNGWCTAGGDDTIVTNITFTDGTTTEISSHTVAVPYEDGWTHHTFTKSINDTFLTDNVAIGFELSGIDTGDSSHWLGPITDNYELMVTYQDYVAPVVEPVVVEPVVIEPVVVEPVVIEPIVEEVIVIEPIVEEVIVVEPIIEIVVIEPIIEDVVVVEPIVEQVIEPVAIIEEIVVIEETIIGGLELSTEVTLDLIQEIRVEIPQMEIIEMPPDMPDIANIQPIDTIEIEMPEMNMDMDMDMAEPVDTMSIDMPEMVEMPPVIQEIKIEMPVDMPEIIEVEPIQEIQEIQVQDTPQQQPEMVETTNERQEESPENKEQASQEIDSGTTGEIASGSEGGIETSSESGSNVRESSSSQKDKGKTKESTATADQGDEPKETTTVATTKTKTKESSDAGTNSTQSKSKTKSNVKDVKPVVAVKKNTSRPKATLEVSTAKPKVIEQLPLPIAYLQIITDSISIVETISLRQEQIYGGEQEYNLNTSSITIAGLDNNSSRRWNNLQNERKRFKAPKYSRRSKED